jgi:small nuclear ribonucleoprotein (snRNP)-like protein
MTTSYYFVTYLFRELTSRHTITMANKYIGYRIRVELQNGSILEGIVQGIDLSHHRVTLIDGKDERDVVVAIREDL